eukprot:jgi/Tetstr1/449762/TSEL_036827.t1
MPSITAEAHSVQAHPGWGSAYTNPAHEDLPAVLSRRPDLVRQGLHHIDSHAASQGMVDASPANAHPGLARGQRMAQRDGCVVAGIYTCQAQTMAIFFLPSCPDVFLFDSHSREDAGLGRAGAAFRFFRDLPDMCAYIAATFRMDVGDPADEHEAIQLAAMVVGQVDFLCLNDALEARAPVHSGLPLAANSSGGSSDEVRYHAAAPGAGPSHAAPSGAHRRVRASNSGDSSPAPPRPSRRASRSSASRRSSRAASPQPSSSSSNDGELLQLLKESQHHARELQKEVQQEKDRGHSLGLRLRETELAARQAEDEKLRIRQELEAARRDGSQLRRELAEAKAARQASPSSQWFGRPQDLHAELAKERETTKELRITVDQLHSQLARLDTAHKVTLDENSALRMERAARHAERAEPRVQNSPSAAHQPSSAEPPRYGADKAPANGIARSDSEFARHLDEEERQRYDAIQQNREVAARLLDEERRQAEQLAVEEELQRRERDDNELARRLEEARRAAEDRRLAQQLEAQDKFYCSLSCLTDVSVEDKFATGSGCEHAACRDCAMQYVRVQLEARRMPIKCWDPNCDAPIAELRGVLSHGWPEDSTCECAICNHRWCCRCTVDLVSSQHANINCEEFQRWQAENAGADDAFDRMVLDEDLRPCPMCGAVTHKIAGCNHMTCTGCQTHWCWACARFHADNGKAVYDHQLEKGGEEVQAFVRKYVLGGRS